LSLSFSDKNFICIFACLSPSVYTYSHLLILL
jgi:hypothetical protein